MVLSLYIRVDTPVSIEIQTGVKYVVPALAIRVRSGTEGNGATAVLAEILMNNKNTGGTGLRSLLGSSLGLNRA